MKTSQNSLRNHFVASPVVVDFCFDFLVLTNGFSGMKDQEGQAENPSIHNIRITSVTTRR